MLSTPWIRPLVAGLKRLAEVETGRFNKTYDVHGNNLGVVVDLDTTKLEVGRQTLSLVAEQSLVQKRWYGMTEEKLASWK